MSFHNRLKHKIVPRDKAAEVVEALRAQPMKLVFTNGVFDILHPGHVDYLSQARDLGDFLILGLNTDASVRRLGKAAGRPVNDEQSRAMVLAGLESVDLIVLFDEETPYELISELQPDVLVKGDDYAIEQIAGHDFVLAKGGTVERIPLLKGYSTTAIVNKIASGK
jgi:D-glycero-beta-D-manno-heptose 1-phosphate adenylyltransferase